MTAEIINISDFKKAPFKTNQGVFLLRGLFFEETLSDKSTVLFTLKDQDHNGYPSLRRLYMEIGDPTEYYFAIKCLDGWAHWERLCECEWFQPYVERWRRELELRIRSQALARIMMIAQQGGKETFNANKYLIAGGWSSGQVGRPPKDHVKEKALEEFNKSKDVSEDALRLKEELKNVK